VTIHHLDVLETRSFKVFVDALPVLPGTVICAVGLQGDQQRAQSEMDHATLIMRSNYEGPSLILGLLAERFIARGSGAIIGISSVAGDRGRGSNYVYGSAKAGFTAFLSGLRNHCFKAGVQVITVKPGFVRTKMTAKLKLPSRFVAKPETVAAHILLSHQRKKTVIYSPPPWRLVMSIINNIPEVVFRRLSL